MLAIIHMEIAFCVKTHSDPAQNHLLKGIAYSAVTDQSLDTSTSTISHMV